MIDETKGTGERLLTGYFDRYSVEHLHRYAIAKGLAQDKLVLDIASGEGYGSNILAQTAKHVIGVDIDSEIVEHAKRRYTRPNLEYRLGAAHQIPVSDASIELVVSYETLEHHDQHEQMYAEIKRVLAPGGLLIISTPDKQHFEDLSGHRNDYHVKELYKSEFLALTQKYFSNVLLTSQISSICSVVTCGDASGGLVIYNGDLRTVDTNEKLTCPAYHICLASDDSLPNITSSVFESRTLLETQDTELRKLRQQVERISRLKEDLEHSMSFRLGQTLTLPLRKILGRS